ncbi:MAG: hypothetical protein K0Q74_285 [Gammaproteobacteria bacterium]|jgi:hypothetical protein|nr:hypothetical protein [Gammaproteobacteria bacterium]
MAEEIKGSRLTAMAQGQSSATFAAGHPPKRAERPKRVKTLLEELQSYQPGAEYFLRRQNVGRLLGKQISFLKQQVAKASGRLHDNLPPEFNNTTTDLFFFWLYRLCPEEAISAFYRILLSDDVAVAKAGKDVANIPDPREVKVFVERFFKTHFKDKLSVSVISKQIECIYQEARASVAWKKLSAEARGQDLHQKICAFFDLFQLPSADGLFVPLREQIRVRKIKELGAQIKGFTQSKEELAQEKKALAKEIFQLLQPVEFKETRKSNLLERLELAQSQEDEESWWRYMRGPNEYARQMGEMTRIVCSHAVDQWRLEQSKQLEELKQPEEPKQSAQHGQPNQEAQLVQSEWQELEPVTDLSKKLAATTWSPGFGYSRSPSAPKCEVGGSPKIQPVTSPPSSPLLSLSRSLG